MGFLDGGEICQSRYAESFLKMDSLQEGIQSLNVGKAI